MSKNCEIKKYIEKLPLSQTEKERLNNIHNAIGKSAIESKAFRLYEGRIYARKFSYNKAVQFVSSINKQYNTTIAKLVQSLPNQHTLSVNVTSLSKEIQGKLFASTDTLSSNQIQYTLKVINALEDSKVREPNKNFQGFLNDLRNVPKDQLILIKNTYVEGMSKKDLIASLLANYNYTVEINTAKGLGDTFSLNNRYYLESFEDEISYYADIEGTEIITENVIKYRILNPNGAEAFEFENKIDAEKKLEELNSNLPNSNIYNNLTVPGGTNYTENEISIPGQLVEEKPQGVPAKEGVPELFESNPELANSVYEALGFNNKQELESLQKQFSSFSNIRDKFKGNLKDVKNLVDIFTQIAADVNFYKPFSINISEQRKKDIISGKATSYIWEDNFGDYKKTIEKSLNDELESEKDRYNYWFDNGINFYTLDVESGKYYKYDSNATVTPLEKEYEVTKKEYYEALDNYKDDLKEKNINEQEYVKETVLRQPFLEGRMVRLFDNHFVIVTNHTIKEEGDSFINEIEFIYYDEFNYDRLKELEKQKITPQQKQQALQLYSQYLDTIFPNSKVKDIVYRGKTENQTNKKSKELGIFFTDDKNAANIYAIKYKGDEFDDSIIQGVVNKFGLNPTIEQIKSEIAFFEKMGATKEQIEKDAKEFQKYILNNKGIAEQAIINIKNPKNLTVKDWFDNYDNSSSLKENSDGLLLKGGKQSDNRIYDAGENQIVVFEPEQIHILGSKQDIEGFKSFIKSNTKTVRKGAILPSIKGHAQFSTDNGIGWFRSDDKLDNIKYELATSKHNTDEHRFSYGEFIKNKNSVRVTRNVEGDYSIHEGDLSDLSKSERIKLFEKQSSVIPVGGKIVQRGASSFDGIRHRINLKNHGFSIEYGTNNLQEYKSTDKNAVQEFSNAYNLGSVIEKDGKLFTKGVILTKNIDIKSSTKTRRILEIQSDLFQKGRDNNNIIQNPLIDNSLGLEPNQKVFDYWGNEQELENRIKKQEKYLTDIQNRDDNSGFYRTLISTSFNKNKEDNPNETKNQFIERIKNEIYEDTIKLKIDLKTLKELGSPKKYEQQNQFLQLLNKDNNWVTFFIKSIIQDTAKQTVTEVQESDVEAKVRELEKEGLLEIDCKGKLKAEKGLQTNFTKGGRWKIYEIFEGKSHKQGGIDINIKNNQISFTNKNGSIKAKYGLVISKDN